jgi:DNA-binding MarR family transcriptional regulator
MTNKVMDAFEADASTEDWTGTSIAPIETANRMADTSSVSHLELVRLVERVNRRYADLLRVELTRLGIDDVSCAQVMLLFTIGNDELTVRDLLERGHYLGSNASYNLKQLVEGGYVDRSASQRDRRSARLRLSDKGQALCASLGVVDETYHRLVARDEDEVRDLETTYRTLRRLELIWTSTLRYGQA